jgi:hypothetical protein
LPAANSNYPSAADSNGNSGIPAATLQVQKQRFFPLYPLLFFSQSFGPGRGAAPIRSSFAAPFRYQTGAYRHHRTVKKNASLFKAC